MNVCIYFNLFIMTPIPTSLLPVPACTGPLLDACDIHHDLASFVQTLLASCDWNPHIGTGMISGFSSFVALPAVKVPIFQFFSPFFETVALSSFFRFCSLPDKVLNYCLIRFCTNNFGTPRAGSGSMYGGNYTCLTQSSAFSFCVITVCNI